MYINEARFAVLGERPAQQDLMCMHLVLFGSEGGPLDDEAVPSISKYKASLK